MKKRIFIFILLIVSSFLYAQQYAQQLTRVAVVDMPKVYTAYFKDSRAVRQFEEKSAKVQSDIDKMTKEIQDLKSRHADALLRDDQSEVLRLDNLIYRRSEYLREFYQTRTAELENEKKKLMQSGSFLDQVYDEIRYIAESEGYSMVIEKNNNLLWFSNTIDITNKLITNLQKKQR
jgi:outer membrane protein